MTVQSANQRLSESRRNAVWLIAGLLLSVALLFAANWEANRQEQVRMDSFRYRVTDLAKISESIIIEQLRRLDDALLILRRAYADDPKRLRLGWVIYEEIGIVIINSYAVAKITVTTA